jgi:hypothetical protein
MLVINPAFYLSSYVLPTDPKKSSGPANLRTEPSLSSLSAISLPRTTAYLGTQYSQQCAGKRYNSTPLSTVVPMGTLFEQLEVISEPPGYQRK